MATAPQTSGGPFVPAHRPNLVAPILLIAIGLVVLAITTGALDQAVGWRLLQFWPLILVLAGLELVLAWAAPTPVGRVATAAVLLVVTLSAILFAVWSPVRTGPATGSDFTATAGEIARPTLVLDLAGATATIESAALGGDLYSTHFDVASGGQPSVGLDRSTGRMTVRIQRRFSGFLNFGSNTDHVLVKLNQDIPWDVELNGAGMTANAKLSAITVNSVKISGAGAQFPGTLPAASGVVPVTVNGVACTVTLSVPAGTPVVVRSSGLFATVNGAVTRPESSAASAPDRYDVGLSGIAATLTIKEAKQ